MSLHSAEINMPNLQGEQFIPVNKRQSHFVHHLAAMTLIFFDVQCPVPRSTLSEAQVLSSCQVASIHAWSIDLHMKRTLCLDLDVQGWGLESILLMSMKAGLGMLFYRCTARWMCAVQEQQHVGLS